MKTLNEPPRKKMVQLTMVLSFILISLAGICQDNNDKENACNQKLLAQLDARVTLEKEGSAKANQWLFQAESMEEEIEIENWMIDTKSWNKKFPSTFKNNRMETRTEEGKMKTPSLDFMKEATEEPLEIEAWMSDVSRWNE
jgi:hypothetical protein